MSSFELFQEPWWLDAVAPGQWGEVRLHGNGELFARWPYVVKRHFSVKVLTTPAFTPRLGPWMKLTSAKYATRLAREKQTLNRLCDGLPPHDLLRTGCSLFFTNWLPLYWNGFSATPLYTYRIEDLRDEDVLWSESTEATRRAIRKASKEVTVERDSDPKVLLDLHIKTFLRRRQRPRCNAQILRRIIDACKRHADCSVLVGRDPNGIALASMLLVWDQRCAYYLVGGFDPAHRENAAMSLVIWESLKLARQVTRAYDFEGSMIEPIERFFRGFGARQTTYLCVEHTSRQLQLLRAAGELTFMRHLIP